MNRFRYSKNILGAITVLLVICATFFSGIAIAAPFSPISSACTVEEKEPQVIVEPSGEVDIIPPNVIFNKVGECAFTTLKPIKLRELLPNIPEVRAIRIDRAIVQLPPGETVVVKNLQINQIDDEGGKTVIYGCSNLKVNNGTDLNVSCGEHRTYHWTNLCNIVQVLQTLSQVLALLLSW